MKKRSAVLKAIALSCTVFATAATLTLGSAGWAGPKALPESVAIGTTSIGSAPYVVSVGIAEFISKHTGIKATAEVGGGADANARLLRKGRVQLAMLNSFAAEHAYKGDVQFAKEGKIPVRSLIWGSSSLRQVVVRAASGIKTVTAFAGKRILGKRRVGKDTEIVFNALIKAYGVDAARVKVLTYSKPKEIMDAFKAGTADGAVWPATAPNPLILQLQEAVKLGFPSIARDKWGAVLKEVGAAFYMEILPANTYKNQPKDVYVPSIQMGLCTLTDFPAEAAYQITKAVLSRYDEFRLIHPSAKHWTPKRTVKQFCTPLHPGAIRYYKEIGVWTAKHDKKQKAVLALEKR